MSIIGKNLRKFPIDCLLGADNTLTELVWSLAKCTLLVVQKQKLQVQSLILANR